MDELLKIDTTFNEEMFISKVNNIYIMLCTAVMMNDLNRVRHFIGPELEKKYESVLDDLNQKNLKQVYNELNVKTTEIEDINILDDKIVIKVLLISRYMDYLVNKDTSEYVSGVNDHRIEKINHLTFEKAIGSKYNSIVRKCPTCGASMDVNNSGECPYCKTIFDTEDHDYVLMSIEEY